MNRCGLICGMLTCRNLSYAAQWGVAGNFRHQQGAEIGRQARPCADCQLCSSSIPASEPPPQPLWQVPSQTPKFMLPSKTHPFSFSTQQGKRALFSFSFSHSSKRNIQLRSSFLILPHFDHRISVVACDWLVLFVPFCWAFLKFEVPPPLQGCRRVKQAVDIQPLPLSNVIFLASAASIVSAAPHHQFPSSSFTASSVSLPNEQPRCLSTVLVSFGPMPCKCWAATRPTSCPRVSSFCVLF